MLISVVNRSRSVSDRVAHEVIRAVNRQLQEDFRPFWHIDASLRLEGVHGDDCLQWLPDLRGDAILFIEDSPRDHKAGGYHAINERGIPYRMVFTKTSNKLKEPWSQALSHEALEMAADPECNRLAQGPHPEEDRSVFHWMEICDPVQGESYKIDSVTVSNFVLPHYYTRGEERGMRNDFLNESHEFETLKSFGVKPGGYFGFYDPKVEGHQLWVPDDVKAQSRAAVKEGSGRNSVRRDR